MDAKQKEAIVKNRSDLIQALSPNEVLVNLLADLVEKEVISTEYREMLNHEKLNKDKIMKLLDNLKWKGKGWPALIEFLTTHQFDGLVSSLNSVAGVIVSTGNQAVGNIDDTTAAEQLLNRQNVVLQSNADGLCTTLHPDLIIPYLQIRGLIKGPTVQIVNAKTTDEAKIFCLLTLMASNPKFFDAILGFLNQNGFTPLHNKLMKDLRESD